MCCEAATNQKTKGYNLVLSVNQTKTSMTFNGFRHCLECGDHLPPPPILYGGGNHDDGQDDGAKEEEEPEDAINPEQGLVDRVTHAMDRGPRPKLC